MKLKFLGIGSAYNPSWGSNTAFFALKDQLYLLDCGENAFERMAGRPELAECGAVTVLVTHRHADHIGSLGSFISYCTHVLGKPVSVATPDETVQQLLSLMGIQPDDYAFRKDFTKPFPGGLTVTPLPVEHAPGMACYGYYLCDGEETVFYSGDSNSLPSQVIGGLMSEEIARAYQETTYREGVHAAHCSLEQLCVTVPHSVRGRVVCMHFNDDFLGDIRNEGFQAATPVSSRGVQGSGESICRDPLGEGQAVIR